MLRNLLDLTQMGTQVNVRPWLHHFECGCTHYLSMDGAPVLSISVPTWIYVCVADFFASWQGTPTCPLPLSKSLSFTIPGSNVFTTTSKNYVVQCPTTSPVQRSQYCTASIAPIICPCGEHCSGDGVDFNTRWASNMASLTITNKMLANHYSFHNHYFGPK